MNNFLVVPILLPFATAAVGLLLRRQPEVRQFAYLTGTVAHLAAAAILLATVLKRGIQVLQIGGWPAPFGITLVADHLSALMLAVTGILATATAIYGHGERIENLCAGDFASLFQILVGGLSGAFLTGDLFNLYVWFEVMLMASFGLLMRGQTKPQFDGAVKYVVINLLATLLFLLGLALLYGLTGTLNMAHLYHKVAQHDAAGLLTAVAYIFMAAFGIKAGIFPLFFWLPASYHTPPVAVSAFFAGMLTKVGVYALVRVFSIVFHHDNPAIHGPLLVVAGLTMVTGVLGAAAKNEFRRILSIHIISQVGYMVLGLAIWTPLALAGAIFYLVHNMIVKANLFLLSGLGRDLTGTMALKKMGGIFSSRPLVAVLFLIPALSLAGVPPLSGFWGKLLLIQSSLQARHYLLAALAVAVGLMTLFSMVKIWIEAFWKPAPHPPAETDRQRLSAWKMAPVCALTLLTLAIGLGAEPVYRVAAAAALNVTAPQPYLEAVLKVGMP